MSVISDQDRDRANSGSLQALTKEPVLPSTGLAEEARQVDSCESTEDNTESTAPEPSVQTLPARSGGTSWNTHAVLTRAALGSVDQGSLDRLVPVVRLEEFLDTVGTGIRFLLGWYWGVLGRKAGTKPSIHGIPRNAGTVREFMKALKLNPSQSLQYVRVMTLEEMRQDTPHNSSRSGPPGGAYLPTHPGELMSVREILCMYSDEPDWGMDQNLFPIKEYEYGRAPFGTATGPSSQASFHMAFLHEPTWLTTLWPGLTRSFMEERIGVCLALARLAFKTRSDYWGWRFAAWAMHYVQDLTQPYHARAFPLSKLSLLLRFVRDPHPLNFAARNSNLLRNHHILFEATAHYLLNQAVKNRPDSPLLQAIREGGETHAPTIRSLMEHSGGIAADLAQRSDRALVRLIDDSRLDLPDFSLTEGTDYDMDETVPRAAHDRPTAHDAFLEVLSQSLVQAGRVTRYCLGKIDSALELAER